MTPKHLFPSSTLNVSVTVEGKITNKSKTVLNKIYICRGQLVRSLMEHVKVDVFGWCGNKTCDKDQDCYQMMNQTYKFYLSLENSVCQVNIWPPQLHYVNFYISQGLCHREVLQHPPLQCDTRCTQWSQYEPHSSTSFIH